MKQSKKSTIAKARVYSSITKTASAKIAVGLALDETGQALLELSLEAESGSAWRNIEIAYTPEPGAVVRKLSVPAEIAAHIPRLLQALLAQSSVLDPIEAV